MIVAEAEGFHSGVREKCLRGTRGCPVSNIIGGLRSEFQQGVAPKSWPGVSWMAVEKLPSLPIDRTPADEGRACGEFGTSQDCHGRYVAMIGVHVVSFPSIVHPSAQT